MKRAKHKDFLMEIKKTSNRFLSILFIVALGVAFFSGIRSARPDMELSADRYYDDTRLMDLRIVGTLGLTEGDVSSVRSMEEIALAVGGYTADVLCQGVEEELAIRMFSVTEDVNLFTVTEGRLPDKAGECLIDQGIWSSDSYRLGDTVKIYSGTEDELSDTLNTDTFTIVGKGMSSKYLSLERGSSGIGDGELDCFMAVTPDDFSLEVYTDIYALTRQGMQMRAYSGEYEDYVKKVSTEIEDKLSKERSRIRYEELKAEAAEKLSDAREELADKENDAYVQLGDAANQIAEAEAKINQGKLDVEKGEADIRKGQADLAKGEENLAKGKQTLAEKAKGLEDARTELSEKQQELLDAKVTLQEKELELSDAKEELPKQEKKLLDAQKEFDEKSAGAKTDLAEGWREYESGLEEYESGKQETQEQEDSLRDGWRDYREGKREAEKNLKKLLLSLKQMGYPIDLTDSEISGITVETFDLNAYGSILETIQTPELSGGELTEGIRQLQMSNEELKAGEEALKEGKRELAAAKRELDKAKKKLDKGESKLRESQDKLVEAKKKVEDAKIELADGEQKLADAKQDIIDGEQKIQDAYVKIADGEQKLADARKELWENEGKIPKARRDIENGKKDIEEAKFSLADGELQLMDARKEYEDAKTEAEEKIADAHKELNDAQGEIDDIKEGEWFVLDRNAIQTYQEYGNDAERIGAIGEVFPVIFFLVAALVSLTAMTRMVEEQRLQIGTLKALGYSKWSIASKYLLYAFLATLGGSALGVLIGEKVLPYVIMTAYFILYRNLPVMLLPYHGNYAVLAAGLALACTVVATWAASYRELISTPAALMRPEAPKQGKRVVLEYIKPLWRRLGFIQKATVRNLFRYKKRCLMTIFGIGGCMALLLVGFGLNDSISTIGENQYDNVWTFDIMLQLDDEAGMQEKNALEEYLSGGEFAASMKAKQNITDVEGKEITKEAYLFVPDSSKTIGSFVHLRNRLSGESYVLGGDEVLVTEKLANLLGVSPGDTLFLKESEQVKYPVIVGGIAENYLHHYVYMSEGLYRKVYGESPEYNTLFLNLNDKADKDLGRELVSFDYVNSTTFIATLRGQIKDMMDSLNVVIWVLIFSAGLLAFVVLYNLNHINISERQRELATIKVLGFFDSELAAYIYRENIILTVLGSAAGAVMGFFLHRYVMLTVEVDMLMFGRQIKPMSYVYSILLTYLFSAFVNGVMYYKLKKIDMVESLKSVE